MKFHFYHHHSWDEEVPPWVDEQTARADLTLDKLDALMIDTSKLLESARKQSTENASLRALLASVKEQLTKSTADLAAAIAASDPAATAAAQKDINDTVALLDADDAATEAALSENVQPAPQPASDAPSA
jgi:hypothetical protein